MCLHLGSIVYEITSIITGKMGDDAICITLKVAI